jgi:hypothetical protein
MVGSYQARIEIADRRPRIADATVDINTTPDAPMVPAFA